MSPPSVIGLIIRPSVTILKIKIISVGAVCTDVCALFIAFRIFINAFPIHPLIKGTAMVEDSVQNHLHASFVSLFHHLGKKRIACFQVLFVGHAGNILACKPVFLLPGRQKLSLFPNNLTEMRVNIIIILNIILMIGGGYKQGVKVNHFHAKVLQIIHLFQYTL